VEILERFAWDEFGEKKICLIIVLVHYNGDIEISIIEESALWQEKTFSNLHNNFSET